MMGRVGKVQGRLSKCSAQRPRTNETPDEPGSSEVPPFPGFPKYATRIRGYRSKAPTSHPSQGMVQLEGARPHRVQRQALDTAGPTGQQSKRVDKKSTNAHNSAGLAGECQVPGECPGLLASACRHPLWYNDSWSKPTEVQREPISGSAPTNGPATPTPPARYIDPRADTRTVQQETVIQILFLLC